MKDLLFVTSSELPLSEVQRIRKQTGPLVIQWGSLSDIMDNGGCGSAPHTMLGFLAASGRFNAETALAALEGDEGRIKAILLPSASANDPAYAASDNPSFRILRREFRRVRPEIRLFVMNEGYVREL